MSRLGPLGTVPPARFRRPGMSSLARSGALATLGGAGSLQSAAAQMRQRRSGKSLLEAALTGRSQSRTGSSSRLFQPPSHVHGAPATALCPRVPSPAALVRRSSKTPLGQSLTASGQRQGTILCASVHEAADNPIRERERWGGGSRT